MTYLDAQGPTQIVNNVTYDMTNFTNTQRAINWLRSQQIYPNDDLDENLVLRLSLAAARYEFTKSLIIDHVNAPYLWIRGQSPITVGTPSAATSSGSSGAHTITMTTTAAHGLSVGDFVVISLLEGTGKILCLEGGWTVLTVPTPTTFTYLSTAVIDDIETVTISDGSIVKYPTVLSWTGTNMMQTIFSPYTSDPGALDIRSCRVRIQDVALVSDGADLDGCGIMARFADSVNLQNVAVSGFGKAGIWNLFNSYIYGLNVYVTGCGFADDPADGIASQQGAVMNITNAISVGNAGSGVRGRDAAGSMLMTDLRCGGNGSGGLTGEGWSKIFAVDALIEYNTNATTNGDVRCEKGTVMDIRSATITSEESAYGLLVRDGGQAIVDSAVISGAATKDIRVDNGQLSYGTAPTYTSFGITSGWIKNAFYQNTNDWIVVDTNAAFTLTPLTSRKHQVHTGTLTANRAVTLSTTDVYTGTEWIIYRLGGGAFTLDIGTGPLVSLDQGEWARVVYDGAAFVLAANGTI